MLLNLGWNRCLVSPFIYNCNILGGLAGYGLIFWLLCALLLRIESGRGNLAELAARKRNLNENIPPSNAASLQMLPSAKWTPIFNECLATWQSKIQKENMTVFFHEKRHANLTMFCKYWTPCCLKTKEFRFSNKHLRKIILFQFKL